MRLTQIDAAGFSAKFEDVAQDAERVVRADRPRPTVRLRKLDPADIVTITAHQFDDARGMGEAFRAGKPVFLDLTQMDDDLAKRLVDFSAGITFVGHGTINRVGYRKFLLLPAGVSAD